MTRKPILFVYVAGPYSADTWEGIAANIREAEKTGIWLAENGFYPLMPQANTGAKEFHTIQDYQFWLDATAELMVRAADVVLFKTKWRESNGSKKEFGLAERTHIPAVFEEDGMAYLLARLRQLEMRLAHFRYRTGNSKELCELRDLREKKRWI